MRLITPPRKRVQGFTLLELLVVMFILVMLAGMVTVLVTKRMEDAKHARAVTDIETFGNAIDQYHLQNGEYPPTLEALRLKPSGDDLPNWDGPYIKKPVPDDPWKRAYVYTAPGEKHTDAYDLFSLGRDGVEGGKGNDADIDYWE